MKELEEAGKAFGGTIIVSWSGGKDSRVVCDMAVRTGLRVKAFFMEWLPGMPYSDEMCGYAEQRWGITPVRYLHWATVGAMVNGVYCDAWYKRDSVKWTLDDIYACARHELGGKLIATGAKKADSGWRRRQVRNIKPDVIWPLMNWTKFDILSYLAQHKIPAPDGDAGTTGAASGIDLSTPALLWLHDKRPEDWAIMKLHFPYVEAAVLKAKWYPPERRR